MKTFKYTARHVGAGALEEGIVQANTAESAIAELRNGGLIVSTIDEVGSSRDVKLSFGRRRIKEKSLSLMCSQFAIVLKSGLPIVRAIRSVADQVDDKALKVILGEVVGDVETGFGLADSFEKHGQGLPITFIETVRAGESSGKLEEIFERLSKYYEKSSKNKTKAKSALIYPTFVLAVAVVVVFIIMAFAVPTFKETFVSMGREMPWPTLLMIAVSDFTVSYFWLVVVLVIAAVVAVNLLKRHNEQFALWWSSLGIRVPVLGKINLMSASAQYASTMATMMAAGLPVVHSIDVTARTLSNHYMGNALASIEKDVESGKSVGDCLASLKVFPEFVSEMTAMGEQTGTLEQTLDVVADFYGNEVETKTDRAVRLLEPIMIVVLAFIVLVILLAVYLPMFDIYGNFTDTM
ncbi:MAG: type II secretion system F family protein [Coriobacteriales bacterium]